MQQFHFKEVTAERYNEMLNILFPAEFESGRFLVGEAHDHRECTVGNIVRPTFGAFFKADGRFFESTESMTLFEWKEVTQAYVMANIVRTDRCDACTWSEEFYPAMDGEPASYLCKIPSETMPLCMQGVDQRERETVKGDQTGCPCWKAKG